MKKQPKTGEKRKMYRGGSRSLPKCPTPVQKMSRADVAMVRAIIDGLDHMAVEMEMKWGVDRLRLLVPPDLRKRFDEQRQLFVDAVWGGDAVETQIQGAALERGWRALDQAATDAGAKPLDPVVWETRIGDRVLAVVRTAAEAHAITGDGRAREVWTMEEIARVLAAFSQQVGEAKQVFPGCEVVDVRPPPFNEATGDDLPF